MIQRRQFLARTVRLALGASATSLLGSACSSVAVPLSSFHHFSSAEVQTLTAMTRALLPHPGLAEEHYVAVVIQLDLLPAPEIKLIREGISRMNNLDSQPWLSLAGKKKQRVLEAMQTEAFFSVIQTNTIEILYQDPELWRLIGYQGSSIEFGGYLNRGFDDIDWLP
jgi:hypothetical protein